MTNEYCRLVTVTNFFVGYEEFGDVVEQYFSHQISLESLYFKIDTVQAQLG